MKILSKTILTGAIIIGVGILPDHDLFKNIANGNFTTTANARVGRPATPGSVAGVARRTTRRSIRRSNQYVNTLPQSCSKVVIEGTTLWLCGSTYYQSYQSYNSQYVVVYVE